MKRTVFYVGLLFTIVLSQHRTSSAAVVAGEDFDGGALNLISSNVPTIDGGGGDTHAVGATQAWPTAGGTPFGLADNSLGAVGDTTAFPNDNEGVYGVNSNFANRFLGISDTRGDGAGFGPMGVVTPVISTWTFNIDRATELMLSIGMGSMEGSTFTYGADTRFLFTYSIDGGQAQTAFDVTPDASGVPINFRALDGGLVVTGTDYLSVTGPNPVSKILSDTGLIAGNTYLDKTPGSGAGAGNLDSFQTALNGSGSVLELTLSAYIPQESAAFDNISISGNVVAIPEPSSFAALAAISLGVVAYRRRSA